jgi:hypothetical protein
MGTVPQYIYIILYLFILFICLLESELAWKGKVIFPFFGWVSTETLIVWNKGINEVG